VVSIEMFERSVSTLTTRASPRLIGYTPEYIGRLADVLTRATACPHVWCVFDNTAAGAAIANALELQESLERSRERSDSLAPLAGKSRQQRAPVNNVG
jgi:uncharacterized protein YecE (DUF72 family)